MQAACDTSIARVTGCVYPREGHRSVTHPANNARVNRIYSARSLQNCAQCLVTKKST